jgi:uncharacterized protein YukE
LKDSRAYWERIRGYLPRYPGPSRYVSQEHIIGGTVVAVIILAAILVRPIVFPPIETEDPVWASLESLESELNRLADLLQDINDDIRNIETKITGLEEASANTRSLFQDMQFQFDSGLQDLSDSVGILEDEVVSIQTELEELEEIVKPTWDYVALGFCLEQDEAYVDYYADYVEEDLMVRVRLHDRRVVGFRCSEFLSQLREDQELRDLIREAEIITMGGIDGFWPDDLDDAYRENDTERAMEILPSVKADIDAILDEILTLRSVNNTIIRINNCYNGGIDEQKDAGTFHITKLLIDDLYGHIVAASLERNIPAVMTYQALNGPDGEEMPPEEFQTTVGGFTYLSKAGHAFVAGLYRELGYDPLGP